jgi:hypothetical protein
MIWRFWTLTILLFLSVFGGFAFSLGGFDKRKGLEERGLAFIYATGWAIDPRPIFLDHQEGETP